MNDVEIKNRVRDFILAEFLPGEAPDSLGDSTELITSHILDSLATLKLVAFLEETFDLQVEPHETDVIYLNTIDAIASLVAAKRTD